MALAAKRSALQHTPLAHTGVLPPNIPGWRGRLSPGSTPGSPISFLFGGPVLSICLLAWHFPYVFPDLSLRLQYPHHFPFISLRAFFSPVLPSSSYPLEQYGMNPRSIRIHSVFLIRHFLTSARFFVV